MAKLNVPGTAGFNAGKNYMARTFRLSDIIVDPEISKIFKIHDKTLEEIRAKIKKFGYDKSQPVVVWKGSNILVDGHTRLAAAKAAGLEEIPTVEMEFDDRDSAVMYTFERQVLRRNLTGPEILTAARMLPDSKAKSGEGRAAAKPAERLDVSPATVYAARKILKEAPAEEVRAIENGDKSIKAVYKQMAKQKQQEYEKQLATETAADKVESGKETLTGYIEQAQAKITAVKDIATYPVFTGDAIKLLDEALECLERARFYR